MPVESLENQSPKMPAPTGRAVGFVDTKSQCDAVTQALIATGIPDTKLIVLSGEDGLQRLEHSAQDFYFGDGEIELITLAREELKKSHYGLFVEVSTREEAERIIAMSTPLGGHSFSYFGTWVNERLTK